MFISQDKLASNSKLNCHKCLMLFDLSPNKYNCFRVSFDISTCVSCSCLVWGYKINMRTLARGLVGIYTFLVYIPYIYIYTFILRINDRLVKMITVTNDTHKYTFLNHLMTCSVLPFYGNLAIL